MTNGHITVLRRSSILWAGTVMLIAVNFFVFSQSNMALIYAALAANGAFALFGIGFGIWAAKTVTKRT